MANTIKPKGGNEAGLPLLQAREIAITTDTHKLFVGDGSQNHEVGGGGGDGDGPVQAWVNFNGTGTVAIRASSNVSSITDNGTGDYTVNFNTDMPAADYAAIAGPDWSVTSSVVAARTSDYATGSARVRTLYGSTLIDMTTVCLAVFR